MIDSITYKKEIVRMWDSLREDHKGERTCVGVNCRECPLEAACNNNNEPASESIRYNVFEAIKAVEQWSKAHPVVTNADKFKEVFGREPKDNLAEYYCPSFILERCPDKGCYNCKKSFWESEYKAPTESEEHND